MHATQPDATVLLCELLPPEPAVVALARRRTEAVCAGLVVELGDVVLVVAELVTNAVVHGLKQPITLSICWHEGLLWVEVGNMSRPWPGLRLLTTPPDDATSGRGLLIALHFSRTLQVDVDAQRTVVSASFGSVS